MLGTANVQQSIAEKQCFSVAHRLIERAIELKGCWPPSKDLASDPRIKGLLNELDKWVEHLCATEGGL